VERDKNSDPGATLRDLPDKNGPPLQVPEP